MNELLTIAEIQGKFDSEWVLIEDPSTDESLEVRGGTVTTRRSRSDLLLRSASIFAPVNCASIKPRLMVAAMFGHTRAEFP